VQNNEEQVNNDEANVVTKMIPIFTNCGGELGPINVDGPQHEQSRSDANLMNQNQGNHNQMLASTENNENQAPPGTSMTQSTQAPLSPTSMD
jgi:hypothetical protein